MILFRVATHQKVTNYPVFSLTYHWPLNTFHWPLINENQSMFTFTLAFFAGHQYFSLHFQSLSSFHRKREKELKESIHNKNHWPQLLQRVRRTVSNWLLFLPCSILFIFSERKCISKSWRKLMNYKPENRIPWPFTDFEKFVFPWLFPDRGNPAVTSLSTGRLLDDLTLSVVNHKKLLVCYFCKVGWSGVFVGDM